MSKLKISDDLSLPLELAARTQCIFAQKGAGKTYTAMVQTEEMLAAGVQVVVLDPTGVWWGLQSSADGGKSQYEIIVMGGGHADVPLEPDAGEVVAQFLVETGQSVVLDVSQFESQAAQDRFALALATKLYRLKAYDKANVHIMLDEADQFCPLRPQKGQERLLHAWDMIVRLGRSRGLGLTAISQRPAAVHTNIRNNVDLLTCLRVTGPHDFKALREWTALHATAEQAKDFLESVPTLDNGVAWFWSPAWLGIFKCAKVRAKHTYDSSRTPKPGERPVEPKARRAPDLTKLSEQIKASVQRAKENDPKELKRMVADLQRQLAGRSTETREVVKEKIVEVPVLKNGQLDRTEKAAGRLEKMFERLAGEADKFRAESAELRRLIAPAAPRPTPAPHRQAVAVAARPATAPRRPVTTATGPGESLPKAERRILAALAQYPDGRTIKQVAVLTGYAMNGGGFRNALGALRSKSYIVDVPGLIAITDVGVTALGDYEPLPHGDALLQHWYGQLGKAEREILEVLAAAHPDYLSIDEMAQRTLSQYAPGGGGFRNALGRLRTLELVEGRSEVKASDELFG